MKKLGAFIGGLLAFASICSLGGVWAVQAAADNSKKVIDVYVIAGQSNAAGCATISSLDASRKKEICTQGFDDIYVFGKVDVNES
jgi:hypothetical protein